MVLKKRPVAKKLATFVLASALVFSPLLGYSQVEANASTTFNYVEGLEQSYITKLQSSIDQNRMMGEIKKLEIGNRIAGSKDETEAAEYLLSEFKSLGLDANVQDFTYTRNNVTKSSKNVITTIPAAKDPENAKTIIVGAHFDSTTKKNETRAPGANDNASGTAVLLEAVRIISQSDITENLTHNIQFVAFGAEEEGLQGSKYFVENLKSEDKVKDVQVMINMDMVGVGTVMSFNYSDKAPTQEYNELGMKYAKEYGYTVQQEFVNGSDHRYFEAAGIPAAYLEWQFGLDDNGVGVIDPNYHSPKDLSENVDQQNLENTAKVLLSMLVDVQDIDSESGTDEAREQSKANMMKDLNAIASKDNARVTGFEGEHEAADYMVKQFKEMGLSSRKQIIKDIDGFVDDGSVLSINGEDVNTQNIKTMTYSAATNGTLEGELVYAGIGTTEECNNANLNGKIALIQRGSISFGEKAENAYKAGAKGVIIYNNANGIINGTLGSLGNVPTVDMSGEIGSALKARLDNGEVINVSMQVNTFVEEDSYSYNVIGTLPAAKNSRTAQTIVVGAHFDSVNCAGANDNASGTVSILEAARILSQPEIANNLKYNIEFIGFGAEEIGLIGSQEYVQSLIDSNKINKVKAMINLDMVGVGNNLVLYNSNGNSSHELTDLAKTVADGLGYLNASTSQDLHSTSSDHAPFEAVGIPSTFLTYRMDESGTLDEYYHRKTDVIPTINSEWLCNTTDVVVNTVLEMQSQPPRKVSATSKYSLPKLENSEIPSI